MISDTELQDIDTPLMRGNIPTDPDMGSHIVGDSITQLRPIGFPDIYRVYRSISSVDKDRVAINR